MRGFGFHTEYTFVLSTEYGKMTVHDFEQIESALKQQNERKNGIVKMEISPAIGGILSIENVFRGDAFYTYVLEQREDGLGYWYKACGNADNVADDFKRLYKKHKKINLKSYTRKETGEGVADKSDNGESSCNAFTANQVWQQEEVAISLKDIERCLLQQTSFYEREDPILVATDEENELLFISYYTNTFYIVKAAYENDKLTVKYDYRRKHTLLEEFGYHKKKNSATALLKLMGAQVEFTVQPKVNYKGGGFGIVIDQTLAYNQFVGYLDTYRENINESAAQRKEDNGYFVLRQHIRQIGDTEKEEIWKLLDDGNQLEAIRQIQAHTGLGLADCKKIAENPNRYL